MCRKGLLDVSKASQVSVIHLTRMTTKLTTHKNITQLPIMFLKDVYHVSMVTCVTVSKCKITYPGSGPEIARSKTCNGLSQNFSRLKNRTP